MIVDYDSVRERWPGALGLLGIVAGVVSSEDAAQTFLYSEY